MIVQHASSAKRVIVFDMDDTLYDESTYVLSGFVAVAKHLEERFNLPQTECLQAMRDRLAIDGRGQIFDAILSYYGVLTHANVKQCVKVYRHHAPSLDLWDAAHAQLDRLRGVYPLYLVTDGHKIAQARKVEALKLHGWFDKVYITHRYGRASAKPSLHCFELVRRRERAAWPELVYIGDNPAKDFVSLNRVGAHTIRVLTGRHRHDVAQPGFDAEISVHDLTCLPEALERVFA